MQREVALFLLISCSLVISVFVIPVLPAPHHIRDPDAPTLMPLLFNLILELVTRLST